MNISENEIDDETLSDIEGYADDAATLLSLGLTRLSTEAAVEAVDAFVHNWQKDESREVSDIDELSLTLGSLWGEQIIREFGWQWGGVTFHDHDDSTAVGVFSADRSLAIYPFHFIYGCMENNAPVTIMLAFDILKDGTRIPTLPPDGYENVMDNVHHAVPRD